MAETQGNPGRFRTLTTVGVLGLLGGIGGGIVLSGRPGRTEQAPAPDARPVELEGFRSIQRLPAAPERRVAVPKFATSPPLILPAEAAFAVEAAPVASPSSSETGSQGGTIRLVVETFDITANRAATAPAQAAPAIAEAPAPEAPAAKEADEPIASAALVSALPATPALDARRNELAGFPELTEWSASLDAEFAKLALVESWSDARIGEACVGIAALSDRAHQMAFELQDPGAVLALQELGYDLERRVDLWSQIHAIERSRVQGTLPPPVATSLESALASIEELLAKHPERDVWRTFLLLPDLDNALAKEMPQELRPKAESAIYARFRHADLSPEQRAYLAQPEFARFQAALTLWSLGPDPVRRMASELEAFETSRGQAEGKRLARIALAFRAANDPALLPLAESLERHYRNANLRVSVGNSFARRFVPQPQVTAMPVRDTIRGAWVSGRSETLTRLGIEFVPAEDSLQFQLTVAGDVESATTASVGPARLFSDGSASFVGAKPMAVTAGAFEKGPTHVQVRSQSLLRGFRTEYDDVPLLSSIVRNQVAQRAEEERPLADREVNRRVAARIQQYVDAEVDRRIAEAEGRFREKSLDPLARLGVELSAVELETTAERMIARYRLTHPEQLAAFTPRPQALTASEISVQVHESAVNNVLEQADLFGREMLLTEMLERVRGSLGSQDSEPMDVPEGISLRLASGDGAMIRFDEDRMTIELRVKRIAEDGETLYRNFLVRAHYRATVDGLQVKLARDGVLELGGERLDFRSQIALRAIFSKVFSENRELVLVKDEFLADPRIQGLAVGQIVMHQGWLGVSLVPGLEGPDAYLAPAPIERVPLR